MNLLISIGFFFFFLASTGFEKSSSQMVKTSLVQDSVRSLPMKGMDPKNIVYQILEEGKIWQDIGKGLPNQWQTQVDPLHPNQQASEVFTNPIGLTVRVGNRIYVNKRNASPALWEATLLPGEFHRIAPSKKGIFTYDPHGQILQKANGQKGWAAMFPNFKEGSIISIFETSGGTLFIGTSLGFYKSTNLGKTWKKVLNGGGVGKMIESNGKLFATSMKGIIKSNDDGDQWTLALSEGGAGIFVEKIEGGIAAINYNTGSRTRRIRCSYDGGISWQAIDAGLLPSSSVSSIVQSGKYLYCGHPTGIYQSADKGKTWQRIRCTYYNTVFHLSVSGNVLYAIPRAVGC